jgi:hypothetical protein
MALSGTRRVTEEGRFVPEEKLVETPDLQTESPYVIEDDNLKQWIEFLRHCGGFRAW